MEGDAEVIEIMGDIKSATSTTLFKKKFKPYLFHQCLLPIVGIKREERKHREKRDGGRRGYC